MVHEKENFSLAFLTTQNHFEIGAMKQNFQNTFRN